MTLSARDFELLLQANRILSSKLDIDEVLQAVMELATQVVRAEASSLLMLDENANELYFNIALGEAGEKVKQLRIKVGEGIAGWVAQEKLPLIVNDVSKDSRFTGRVDKSTEFRTKSILAVPLLLKGKVLGVVEAINKENNGEFIPADQEAFEIFASQSAIAIENARLFSVLKREKEKLDTVFSEMSDGVIYTNELGHVLVINAAGSRFLGLNPADASGKRFSTDFFPGLEIAPSFHFLEDLKDPTTLVELVRHGPNELSLTALIHRFSSSEESFHDGWLIILRDVTEAKRGERIKRNFLSLISHKLKTPLTVILGYAPTLLSRAETLNDFQKKAVLSIRDQGEHLAGLVDKLLRFTMLESDTLKPQMEDLLLWPLLEKAMEDHDELIQEKKVALDVDSEALKKVSLRADKGLAIEVFKNLIENGIKFNDKNNKIISITFESTPQAVTVCISDNGIGIPPEEVEKVFQKFYQIDTYFTGQVPGAGLGLPLCKKVMQELGGTIHLHSRYQEGTKVSVTFPRVQEPI